MKLVALLITTALLLGSTLGADDHFFRSPAEKAVFEAARLEQLDPTLLAGLCWHESGLDPARINEKDGGSASYGLCQVKLGTARGLGFQISARDLLRPDVNARVAARYLAYQLGREHGDVVRALAAYNAGRVIVWNGRIVNRAYVEAVAHSQARFANLRGFL